MDFRRNERTLDNMGREASVFAPHDPYVEASIDDRVFLHGVSWEDYERLLEMRGDRSAPRIQYLDGTVEIMSPSGDHEGVKKRIARLFEAYTEELGIEANGYGSMTVRKKRMKRGVEPDECYVRGEFKPIPDLAIEVIWTEGGLDKLELYRKLGVAELWIWQRPGRIQILALRDDGYVKVRRSRIFKEVDVKRIERFVFVGNQLHAVRALREELR